MAISSTFHLKEMCDFCRVRWPKLFMELNDDSKTDLKRTNLIQKVNLRFIRTSLSCVCHLTDGCVATEVGINFYFSIVFCTISNQCACIICLRHRLLVWLMYKMPLKKRASSPSPLPGIRRWSETSCPENSKKFTFDWAQKKLTFNWVNAI